MRTPALIQRQLAAQRWAVDVRRALHDEPAGPRRDFLRALLARLLVIATDPQ